MKLKYYLRGMGIGIILTALVMGFALGGRKKVMSDAEVIERAKALGMVEATGGVLSQFGQEGEEGENGENDASASNSTLDETRAEISQEINQEFPATGQSLPEVAQEEETGEEPAPEVAGETREPEEAEPVEDNKEGDEESEVAEAAAEAVSTEAVTVSKTEDTTAEANTVTTATDEDATGYKTTVAKTITIPGGMGSDGVAKILFNEGIVDSAASFNQYLIDRRMDRIIRSGTKTIPSGSGYEEIANIICRK